MSFLKVPFYSILAFILFGTDSSNPEPSEITIELRHECDGSYLSSTAMPFSAEIKGDSIDKYEIGKDLDRDSILLTALNLRSYGIDRQLKCLTGYSNHIQFYILDYNQNGDFTDDQMITFNRELSSIANEPDNNIEDQIERIFPLYKIGSEENGSICFRILPDKNYFDPIKGLTDHQKFVRSLQLALVSKDNLSGRFSYKDNDYIVRSNKYRMFFDRIKFFSLTSSDTLLSKKVYKEKDYVTISNDIFKIDSIDNRDFGRITLKRVDKSKGPSIGNREGDILYDFRLKEFMTDTFFNVSDFVKKEKEYLLLDFWGTWCGPCKELTPDLVSFYDKNNAICEVLSIAVQKDLSDLKEYIEKNNFVWLNTVVEANPKSRNAAKDLDSSIVSQLKIEGYPTLILLDSDLNIVKRGLGTDIFYEEILPFFDKL